MQYVVAACVCRVSVRALFCIFVLQQAVAMLFASFGTRKHASNKQSNKLTGCIGTVCDLCADFDLTHINAKNKTHMTKNKPTQLNELIV
jgi:hypothetical protein